MKRLALGALLLLAVPSALHAQPASAAPATPAATQHTASHLAAAVDVLLAMGMDVAMKRSIDTMLQLQMEQNPALRQFEDVLRDFLNRHMAWETVRDDYALVYADVFTEAELHEMKAFYQTPLGRKVAASTPDLMARGARLGQEQVQAHLPELQQAIEQRMQSLSAGSKAP